LHGGESPGGEQNLRKLPSRAEAPFIWHFNGTAGVVPFQEESTTQPPTPGGTEIRLLNAAK
jgi:hypothetical protein